MSVQSSRQVKARPPVSGLCFSLLVKFEGQDWSQSSVPVPAMLNIPDGREQTLCSASEHSVSIQNNAPDSCQAKYKFDPSAEPADLLTVSQSVCPMIQIAQLSSILASCPPNAISPQIHSRQN